MAVTRPRQLKALLQQVLARQNLPILTFEYVAFQVESFRKPNVYLEQCMLCLTLPCGHLAFPSFFFKDPTPPDLATAILFFIQESYGDIEGAAVGDLGIGGGMLTIGTRLLGSR